MSLATRVSAAFLVALALTLAAFSATLYVLASSRLRLGLDQDLESVLDAQPEGPGGHVGRVTWAFLEATGDARRP
ncbi:MAG: hypothetical protein K2X91_15280, partial [Thermoleophilia bacterium]|nr:hypothetical protein [Thermoleophilia bacterium]